MYFGHDDSSSNGSNVGSSERMNYGMDCNLIICSEAGKPIYSRFGSEEQIARICGLIQAIRTSLLDPRMALGDVRSLTSGKLKLVFMTVHSITLMAVANLDNGDECETEAYLRLQLEHVYGQLLLTLTEQVQNVFLQNPNYDLRETLGASTESFITEMLKQAGPCVTSAGSFLAGGVESVYPITPQVRDNASRALYAIGEHTENTVFALLLTGTRLLTIVQPRYVPHQLSAFDLHLLIHFCHTRPGLLTSELWFPISLPRFNSSGFLYTYTNCLEKDTELTLVLLSQSNTTQQFQLFRKAASVARTSLGLPQEVGNVLRIISHEGTEQAASDDIAWKRSLEQHSGDDDYVDAALDADGEMIPYVFKDSSPPTTSKSPFTTKSILLDELESTLNPEVTTALLQECCEVAHAKHFLFRLDAPVQNDQSQTGKVTQCLSSSLDNENGSATRRLYSMYQKLQLRLRLGSASCESTMDALDVIARVQAVSEEEHMKGIGRHCPASCLTESPPSVQGVTYVIDGPDLFLAMNGREFEV